VKTPPIIAQTPVRKCIKDLKKRAKILIVDIIIPVHVHVHVIMSVQPYVINSVLGPLAS
jgi:hypothetical protein